MLDAVACSWGACYTSTSAKSAGVGMNSDGVIIKWDGTYWSQLSNSSNKVMKFMDLYNTDTVLVNYAVGRSSTGLWYDDGLYSLKATSIASINAPCLAKGMRAPTINESTWKVSNGVPSTLLTTPATWSNTPKDSGAYVWYGTTLNWTSNLGYGFTSYLRCVK